MKKACLIITLLMVSACGSEPPPPAPLPEQAPAANAPVLAPMQSGFSIWLEGVRREAAGRGISQEVLNDAFASVQEPSEDILERDQTQPEHVKTFPEYMDGIVSDRRIEAARNHWRTHAQLLSRIERTYGVPAPILLSLWCLESNFGDHQGSDSIIESLATLAYDDRRAQFFRGELMNALLIMQQQGIPASALTGSWAGAMGQTQFMPSSYLKFAVDFDGDGKKDIWNNDADALASIANYLNQSGWKSSESWGILVEIPDESRTNWQAEANSKERHPMKYWRKHGVTRADGRPLPQTDNMARLILPDGDTEYAMLAFANYDVLMSWNRSVYFVTSVGELADAVRSR